LPINTENIEFEKIFSENLFLDKINDKDLKEGLSNKNVYCSLVMKMYEKSILDISTYGLLRIEKILLIEYLQFAIHFHKFNKLKTKNIFFFINNRILDSGYFDSISMISFPILKNWQEIFFYLHLLMANFYIESGKPQKIGYPCFFSLESELFPNEKKEEFMNV
jgi:hypothetical protein